MSFHQQITARNFLLIAEIDPPKGVNIKPFLDQALALKGRVDAVAVTDSEHAIMSMSPLAPCHELLANNMDPLLVINGRDRNRISLQADLLSAWALGVRNVILKEGIDPAWGDQPLVRTSGDLNLDVMAQAVSALNQGKDLGGESLNGGTAFAAGVGIDPSDDINVNRRRADALARYKEIGVQFAVLGPTYDLNIIELFVNKAQDAGIRLFATLMLLKSVAMIRYLDGLAGVPSVPNEFLKRLMDAPVKAQAGLEIAAEFMKDIEKLCSGAVLHALGWGPRLTELLTLIGR
ncbi:MAG: hypothetical protein C4523_03185 [Myxococcales bacterium]|nr:MAG: hypothetical protein C4523_03185 [Myxococcales bacterium]